METAVAGPERGRICGYGRSGPVRDAGAGAVCAGTPGVCKKQQLDVFATELVREAEISGRVGAETDRREESLIEKQVWNRISHGRRRGGYS